jgi:hypothetical protein
MRLAAAAKCSIAKRLKQPDEEDKPTTTDLPLPALAIANFPRSCSGADITFGYQSH